MAEINVSYRMVIDRAAVGKWKAVRFEFGQMLDSKSWRCILF